jgi:hypothetical protein
MEPERPPAGGREDFNVTQRSDSHAVITTKCGKSTVLCRRHPVGAKPSHYYLKGHRPLNPHLRGDKNSKQREAYVLGFRGVLGEATKKKTYSAPDQQFGTHPSLNSSGFAGSFEHPRPSIGDFEALKKGREAGQVLQISVDLAPLPY